MRFILFLAIFSVSVSVSAQQNFQDSMAVARITIQKNNMWVLAAWAGANIVQGTISAGDARGSDHYFHQMNAYWNTVNLAIAGFGLHAAKKQLAGIHTAERNWTEQQKIEKLLLLNTGLDAAYIMTGLYLHERGTRLNRDQPVGYGNSLMLQGGFLLIFDIIQYAENRKNGKALEKGSAGWQVGTTANGVGLAYRF